MSRSVTRLRRALDSDSSDESTSASASADGSDSTRTPVSRTVSLTVDDTPWLEEDGGGEDENSERALDDDIMFLRRQHSDAASLDFDLNTSMTL